MLRRRELAAAPVRNTSETWQALTVLVTDTLDRSAEIDADDVAEALDIASGVGRILIAGGHLEGHPLSVLAGTMHLAITTVSGTAAASLEENLNPVPGCANAEDWMIHLPDVEPLSGVIRDAASRHPHLSAEEPAEQAGSPRSGSKESLLDEAALREWAEERP
jgi:hypothetical protein